MPKQNFYAVRAGRKAGVYLTWDECETQVKQYQGAIFKKFMNAVEAEAFVRGETIAQPMTEASGPTKDVPRGQKRALPSVLDESEWIVVYCDGACKGNGQKGSVAGVGVFWGPNDPRNIAERCPGEQTNNRAELIAIIRVLETAPVNKKKLLIKTDSQYSINCFERWLPKWQKNEFHTVNGVPVKNAGIIRYLSALLEERGKRGQQIRLQYVKGHSGEPGNEGADAQANLGTALLPRAELDWGALEAQASERTDALFQTATNDTVAPQPEAARAQAGSSIERPAKISRSSTVTPTEPVPPRTNYAAINMAMRARTPGPVSATPTRPPHSPLSLPPSNPDTRPTIYQKVSSIHEEAQATLPPTHTLSLSGVPVPPHPLVTVPSIPQTVGIPHIPASTSTETFPRAPVTSSPLRVSKVNPPLVPVPAAEIDFEMYKDCLLEGEDWEKEVENL